MQPYKNEKTNIPFSIAYKCDLWGKKEFTYIREIQNKLIEYA